MELKPWITFQDVIGYRFKLPQLLEEALTHKSYAHEKAVQPGLFAHNERMEFLGDAVLDLAVSHMLMHRDFHASEGELSKRRAALVNEQSLASVARAMGIPEYVILGKGERNTHGEDKNSILASTLEAVIGAIYLDGGYDPALKVIERFLKEAVDEHVKKREAFDKDFKTRLQEFCQGKFRATPRYELEEAVGPDHQKTFKVRVLVGERMLGIGAGRSKKEAEQVAAEKALEELL